LPWNMRVGVFGCLGPAFGGFVFGGVTAGGGGDGPAVVVVSCVEVSIVVESFGGVVVVVSVVVVGEVDVVGVVDVVPVVVVVVVPVVVVVSVVVVVVVVVSLQWSSFTPPLPCTSQSAPWSGCGSSLHGF
jgi:hypothetical protein